MIVNRRASRFSIATLLMQGAMTVCLFAPVAHAQSGRDGGIMPPVLRRHLPSQPTEQHMMPFRSGEAVLPPEAIRSLDRLADLMRGQPKARVILYGFADPGEYTDEATGRRLALRRAEAARDYLLLKGLAVQGARLEAVLPPTSYNPPLKSNLPRPASYVMATLLPWSE